MKPASPETIARIKAMRALGHSIGEIAEAVGHGRSCVHGYAKDVKLPNGPLKRGPRAKVNASLARRLRDEGATLRQIAARFRCAVSAVHKALNAGGRS